jgi:ElaB/YqjD/DUF883 family membrane-anchored ribosome-binding protein
MSDTNAAKDRLVEDFNAVTADIEELLKAIANAGGEKAQALRADLDRNLLAAREALNRLEDRAREGTRAAANQADEYVRDNPWQSIALAAGIAALAGNVAGLLIGRK